MKFRDIAIGTTNEINCLLLSIEEKVTKNGNPFCNLTLSDGEQKINAVMFDVDKGNIGVKISTVVKATLEHSDFKGGSWTVKNVAPYGDDVSVLDYIVKAPIDSEEMFQKIIIGLKRYPGELSELAVNIYEKNHNDLLKWSAAKDIHHNYYGGLLYHSYRMMAMAMRLVQVYSILDAELLISATVLHDIGKLKEMNTSDLGDVEYTMDGNLFGHLMLGVEMIDEEVWNNHDLYQDRERIQLLKHCIASHHGELEFGAIKKPAIPEASALYYLDCMDSRVEIFTKQFADIEPGSNDTRKCFALGDYVYKASNK